MPTQQPNNAPETPATDASEDATPARLLTDPQSDQNPGGGTLLAAAEGAGRMESHGNAPNAPFTATSSSNAPTLNGEPATEQASEGG